MHKTALATVALAFAALGTSLGAQEAKPTPQPTPEARGAKLDSKPVLSGYVQVDLRYGEPTAATKQPDHELNVRRLRITFTGKVTGRLSYNATLQGDGTNANSASLLDVSADLTLSPWAIVRAGQYKYDFDLEGRESDSLTPMMDRSFATNAVAGSLNGTSTAANPASGFRDRGVSLIGKGGRRGVKLGYALGLFQGAGRASDNNDAFTLTLNGNIEPVRGLRFNVGALRSPAQDAGAATKSVYSALVLGTAYERGHAFARAEYYRGQRDLTAGKQDLSGFYLTGGYAGLGRLDLLARYETLADERYAASGEARGFGLSAVFYLDRRGPRAGSLLSLTYWYREADDGFKNGLSLFGDGRGAAIENGAQVGNVLLARLQVVF